MLESLWLSKARAYLKANARRFAFVTVGFVLLSLSYVLPVPGGLSPAGFKTLFIFLVAVLWWISAVVPLVITSIFVIIAFPLLGLADYREVYAYFGNTAVFFLLGAFILSSAFARSGLAGFISSRLFKAEETWFGFNVKIFVLSALLSFFMAGNAVAVMLFPIVGALVKRAHLGDAEGQMPFFSMAWGVITGSNLTLLGGARGPLSVAILESLTGYRLGFAQWALMSLPVVLIMGGVVVLFLYILSRTFGPGRKVVFVETLDGEGTSSVGSRSVDSLPEDKAGKKDFLTPRQILVALVFAATVLTWFFFGDKFGIANISLAAVVVLFILNLITWKEVEEDVNWGVILMYGGAIVLARMLQKNGVINWLLSSVGFLGKVSVAGGGLEGHPWLFILVVVSLTLLLTELMSNSAVVVLVLQIAIPLSLRMGINPSLVSFAVGFSSGFAYALPMSSPVLALVHSRWFSTPSKFIAYGFILDTVFLLSVAAVSGVLWLRVFG